MKAGPRPAFILILLFAAATLSAQSTADLLNAGKKAFADGFYPVATESFQRLLSDYPQDPAAVEAEYLLGVSFYYAGRWQESLVTLEGFRERHPGSPLGARVPYWTGASYLRLGSYEKAASLLGGVAGADGSAATPYARHAALLCGVALEGLGRDSQAAAYYRRAAAPGGDPSLVPEAMFRLAGTLYRSGDYSSAQDLYGQIVIGFPQSKFVRDALFFLAECELAVGHPDAAQKRYSTITSVYPDSPYREAALYRLADIAYRRHDASAAFRRLEDLEREFPQGSYQGSAQRLRGDILFDQKKFEDAVAAYGKALDLLRDGSEKQGAWYSLGLADLMLDRKTRAADAFGKAGSGLAKDLGEKAAYQRALLLAGLGRTTEAVEALEDSARVFPDGAHAEEGLKLLAALLDSRMEYEKSSLRWDFLISRYPRSTSLAEYVFRRGNARMSRGDPSALDDFQRVLKDFPSSGFRDQSAYSIGYMYSRRGEYSRALPYFQDTALRAGDSETGARSSLAAGVCLFNMGSFDKALASLQSLRARHPGQETEATAVLYEGRALYRMEKLSDAADRLEKARQMLSLSDSSSAQLAEAADATYWLGWTLYRLGKLAEARDAFLSLSENNPSDARAAEAQYRAGFCETLRGDDAAAVRLLLPVAQRAASASSDQWREQALYEEGWALSRMGKRQESMETFHELAADFPAGRLAPEAFFKISLQAFDEGRFPDARSGFQSVVRDFPRSALAKQALYWSAESAGRAGDMQDAVGEFWACLVGDPGPGLLPSALQGFSSSLTSLGSLETARDLCEKAKESKGLDVQVVAGVEMAYAGMLLPDNPDGALAVLDDVRRRSPPEPLSGKATLLTGQAYAAKSDWQRAIGVFSALSDMRADEIGAEATNQRAHALESSGDAQEAVNQYLRIAYIFPGFPELAAEGLYNAARLARISGDVANARRIGEQLQKRFPASPWTQRLNESNPDSTH